MGFQGLSVVISLNPIFSSSFGITKFLSVIFALPQLILKLNRNNTDSPEYNRLSHTTISLPIPSSPLSGLQTKFYRRTTARDSGLERKNKYRNFLSQVGNRSLTKQSSGKGKVPLKVKVEHIPQRGSPVGRSDEKQQYSM